MFVHLDESGDTGFKFNRGSSRYFVVTILLAADPLPFHAAVDALRDDLSFSAKNEFKWHTSSGRTRWAFLRMLRKQDFTAQVLVIDKTLVPAGILRQRETFYSFLVRMVLDNDDGAIVDATVILDEYVQSKQSRRQLTAYLRHELNRGRTGRVIKDIRYHESHTDNLIQAADMLSGAIYTRYHQGNPEFLDFIRLKIGDLREWPPQPQ